MSLMREPREEFTIGLASVSDPVELNPCAVADACVSSLDCPFWAPNCSLLDPDGDY